MNVKKMFLLLFLFSQISHTAYKSNNRLCKKKCSDQRTIEDGVAWISKNQNGKRLITYNMLAKSCGVSTVPSPHHHCPLELILDGQGDGTSEFKKIQELADQLALNEIEIPKNILDYLGPIEIRSFDDSRGFNPDLGEYRTDVYKNKMLYRLVYKYCDERAISYDHNSKLCRKIMSAELYERIKHAESK